MNTVHHDWKILKALAEITRQEHGNGEPGPKSTLTSVKLCKSQAVAASCFCGKPYIDVLLRAWGRGVLRGGDSKRPPNAKEAWPDQRVRLLQSDVKVTQLCMGLLMKKRSPVPQCGDLVLSRPSFGKRCVLRTVLWIVSHPKGVGTTTDMWWPSNDLIIWSNSMCKLHHMHTNIFPSSFQIYPKPSAEESQRLIRWIASLKWPSPESIPDHLSAKWLGTEDSLVLIQMCLYLAHMSMHV